MTDHIALNRRTLLAGLGTTAQAQTKSQYALAFPTPIGSPVELKKVEFNWTGASTYKIEGEEKDYGCKIVPEGKSTNVLRQVRLSPDMGGWVGTRLLVEFDDPLVDAACAAPIDIRTIKTPGSYF
jgi:hypothetical protein